MAKTLRVTTDFPFFAFSLEADRDYLLARWIHFFAGANFHSRAGFFAQQACEKYMKAYTIQEAKYYLQTHKLLEIAADCSLMNSFFGEAKTKQVLKEFDSHDQVGRYGPTANFDPWTTDKSRIAGISTWSSEQLRNLDRFVYMTRKLLDYKRINFNDSLQSILNRDRNSAFVATWTGRPPLRVVLTRENRYFESSTSARRIAK